MSEPRFQVGDIVYFSGERAVIKRVEVREAGFPDYFLVSDIGSTWAQENEIESKGEQECHS